LRRFIGSPDPADPSVLILPAEEARHAARVVRLAAGEMITVICGGSEYECRIEQISPSMARARIVRELPRSARGVRITLAQGMAKGGKMDDIVRMACEMGVEAFIPLFCGRAAMGGKVVEIWPKLARWKAIAVSAAKVSGGAPCAVLEPMDMPGLAAFQYSGLKLALWEEESGSLKSVLSAPPRPENVMIVAGPEGGFSAEEMAALRAGGFATVSLGHRILRTQTAGVVASAAVLYHFGD